ncbi:MAG: DUF2085 domain-containing protein [Candidatus Thorarchaeota archaeon]
MNKEDGRITQYDAQTFEEMEDSRDIVEGLQMLISHHPPSMFGHCLRVTVMGRSLYFCGRCTGIYGGLGLGLLTLFLFQIRLTPEWLWFFISVTLGFTTIVDWMSQRLTPRKTTNFVRASTGFFSGLALAIIFYLANLLYMLVALAAMSASVGIVGIIENRRRSAYYKDIQEELDEEADQSES